MSLYSLLMDFFYVKSNIVLLEWVVIVLIYGATVAHTGNRNVVC